MDMNRRDFVVAAGLTVCGCTLAGCAAQNGSGAATGKASSKEHDPQKAEAEQTGSVDAGMVSQYPQDGVYDNLAESAGVVIVRQGGRLSALSAVCTHRACDLEAVKDTLRCGCHGSRFDMNGKVTKGPASRDLPNYAIAVTGGKVTVDRGVKLNAGDPKASAAVS